MVCETVSSSQEHRHTTTTALSKQRSSIAVHSNDYAAPTLQQQFETAGAVGATAPASSSALL
eukprot:2157-Heterococcus_DN1.PRE.1